MYSFHYYQNQHKSRLNHSKLNRVNKSLSRSKNFEEKPQNRSISSQTTKKKYFEKNRKRQRDPSRKNDSWINLNQTVKKMRSLSQKSSKKQVNKIFLDDRSDFKPKILYLETPKFGQNLLSKQNLTNSRLSLLFQLQTIKKEFNHNLNQISLKCLQKVSPLKQNLTKSLKFNKDSLRKEWTLIQKSCSQVKNQKENQSIEHMIWQWERKKKRISDIEKNIEKAFSLLLL